MPENSAGVTEEAAASRGGSKSKQAIADRQSPAVQIFRARLDQTKT
jgi:hypothetical protein